MAESGNQTTVSLGGPGCVCSGYTTLSTSSQGALAISDPLNAGGLTILTSSLPPGIRGLAFNQLFTATGGTPPYTWSETGALPTGLTFTTAGVLSGTPGSTGITTLAWTVTDSASATQSVSVPLTISAQLLISTNSLPGGTVSTAYSQAVSASGGNLPFTCSISAGSLPVGLSLSANSGGCLIAGTPTGPGTANFTVKIADSTAAANGGPSTYSQALSMAVGPAISITPTTLANGLLKTAYASTSFSATGGAAPYTWSVVWGSLPAGMPLSSGGTLSNMPSAAGSFVFTIGVNSNHQQRNIQLRALQPQPDDPE